MDGGEAECNEADVTAAANSNNPKQLMKFKF